VRLFIVCATNASEIGSDWADFVTAPSRYYRPRSRVATPHGVSLKCFLGGRMLVEQKVANLL
jgi:hypothetical protein